MRQWATAEKAASNASPLTPNRPRVLCRKTSAPQYAAIESFQRLHVKTYAKTPRDSPMTLEQAVWIDPGRMSGAPCFRGSRPPVEQLFDWLADGVPLDDFVREFRIDRRAATAVLRADGQALRTTAAQRTGCSSGCQR